MMDDSVTTRRQSALIVIGVALVALATGGGGWYGFKVSTTTPAATPATLVTSQSQSTTANLPGSTASLSPASGPLPNSSGIGKGETIIGGSFYARPPPVFDAIAAMALTASAPVGTASGAVAAGAAAPARPAASTPAEVVPSGWAGAGASLDQLWESNAAAAWNVRSTPLTAPNWRISGVVQRGAQTQVIVQFDGEPNTRFFKVGDVLPGGGKLTWVKPNVIGVSFPKQKPLSVPLVEDPFQPASSAASQAATAKGKP